MEALYAAYLTGSSGSSLALFLIGNGIITGVDMGGMKYDGTYRVASTGDLEGQLAYIVPPQVGLITGEIGAPSEPTKIEMLLKLPASFSDGRIIRIETPVGPVNVRFEMLRELPAR